MNVMRAACVAVGRAASFQPQRAAYCAAAAHTSAAPQQKAASLGWSDEVVAAHIHTTVLPAIRMESLDPEAAAERLASELLRLRELGCSVWNCSWGVAMRHFAPRGRKKPSKPTIAAMQKLFDRCILSGVEPNAAVYTPLVKTQRRYVDSRVVFDFMVLDGTTPDEECVLNLLKSCKRYRNTSRHKAESLMSFLEHEGVVPTQQVWITFLGIYAKAGDLPGASGVLLRMKGSGADLDELVFTQFLTACAKSPNMNENFEAAEMAVSQSYGFGIPLSAQGMAQLMRVYARHDSMRRGKQLFSTAVKQRRITSEILWNYAALLKRSSESADRVQARRILREVRKRYIRTLTGHAPLSRRAARTHRRLLKAKANQKKRAKKGKTKKRDDVDLIGDAIRKHLDRKANMQDQAPPAGAAVGGARAGRTVTL